MADLPDNIFEDRSASLDVEGSFETTEGFHAVILRRVEFPSKEEIVTEAKEDFAKKHDIDVDDVRTNLDENPEEEEELRIKPPEDSQAEGDEEHNVAQDAPPGEPMMVNMGPRHYWWILLGVFGVEPDSKLLAYSRKLVGTKPDGLPEIIFSGGNIRMLPRFTCYVAVSSDNAVDRENEFDKMAPHARDRLLRERAAKLSAYLMEVFSLEQSFQG